jgi:predicted ester cyclase
MSDTHTDGLLQRFAVDPWSRGDLSGLDETVADDYVLEPGMGVDDLKGVIRTNRDAFPDLTLTVHEAVTEGNRIAYRWEITGTHQGVFQGIAPTGRRVMVSGMTMLVLRDGKVVHDRFESSSPAPAEQLTTEG